MDITKTDIEKLIEVKENNTYRNHLSTVLSKDFVLKDEVKKKEIKLWRKSIWNRAFYPVFIFEFNSDDVLTNIKDELNPIGKTLIGILLIIIIRWVYLSGFRITDIIQNWKSFVLLSTFCFLMIILFRKYYQLEKEDQIEKICEILIIEKKQEKEWSLKSILTRLFTYPFSIFVISVCVWSLIENGLSQILILLQALAICGVYLYVDLKLIIRDRKSKSKKKVIKNQPYFLRIKNKHQRENRDADPQ